MTAPEKTEQQQCPLCLVRPGMTGTGLLRIHTPGQPYLLHGTRLCEASSSTAAELTTAGGAR